MGRLTNAAGQHSQWTDFDQRNHNDFERGDVDTYVINVPESFGTATKIQLWKGGSDDWCFEDLVTITDPSGREHTVRTAVAEYFCLTNGKARKERTPNGWDCDYRHYSPEWKI
ncbi:PLAT/LH2 domain-containing protein [Streptomyces griseocarneus]|uniref:PLAT/LH2 domain-containing protein n=1 Tax=Streptomyces griseocarneus TaxID=51201 RepID=UPI0019B8222B|nr:PLAT/LH2 domain-containing protein [Streptomyces griseocarneus]MBZ6476146.1 hypothetical protein [Streptomyces griseocarneus]GHG63734.1 hypothetical protein GCM10018779_33620 [Streptomyces griseocarneus]